MAFETDRLFFNLTSPIEYSKGGDIVQTATLEFPAPSMDIYDDVTDLAQYVASAVVEARRFAKDIEKEDIKEAVLKIDTEEKGKKLLDADAMKMILMTAKEVKFKDLSAVFKRIAYKVGTCDGTVKITDNILKKLSTEDYTLLICEYVVNFIVPSLF
jgi:hypothetical protein